MRRLSYSASKQRPTICTSMGVFGLIGVALCTWCRWDGVDDEMRRTDPRFAVPEDLFHDWGPEVAGTSQARL